MGVGAKCLSTLNRHFCANGVGGLQMREGPFGSSDKGKVWGEARGERFGVSLREKGVGAHISLNLSMIGRWMRCTGFISLKWEERSAGCGR
ncbi:hypothetical protein CK203_079126 [Vitis vinifera]|uniref:Uncharacterized protein n=1 Tax=Vitis vinifera TaxID=29760 RepID=A0A438DZD0_VITVI|nr:hypothetical protein CK203_079126 [Vitis vinifera]